MSALIALVAGEILVLLGLALLCLPLALIVAGVQLVAFALLVERRES